MEKDRPNTEQVIQAIENFIIRVSISGRGAPEEVRALEGMAHIYFRYCVAERETAKAAQDGNCSCSG